MKVVIVGGVAGGASAAARLRRLDESAQIIMLERGEYISYANCGLPYFVGGEITDREELTLQTPESFRARFAVDVRVLNEAAAIDRDNKTVTVRRLDDDTEYTESYDKLILSPGAEPVRPPIPGCDDARVFTLRTIPDTYRIHDYIGEHKPRRALVVGGGFIGLEMAENLKKAGLSVTVVEFADHVIGPLDRDVACEVHRYLRHQGVDLRLGCALERLIPQENGLRAVLSGGEELPCDMVLLSVGVRPESGIAREAGLAVNARGAIVVDEQMRTSDPDILAVGDAVAVKNLLTGQESYVPLAGPANKQGRIAADNLCDIPSRYKGTQGSSILKLFDMTVACTGLSEAAARAAGIDCDAMYTLSASHASYYPGARNISVKTIFERTTGKILGAQLVGFEGVDKRCDVLATAIRAGMTAQDLTELELCYAPPFSSAKDPVNMAGFAIENVVSGKVSQFHWHEVAEIAAREDAQILDVRTRGEYARGHIEGAIHIPVDELRHRMGELDPKKTLYVHCQSGLRSYVACRQLAQRGFACKNLSGGYRLYSLMLEEGGFDGALLQPCGVKK